MATPASPTTSPTTPRNPTAHNKRSIDTCNTCRVRKVRCDGLRDVCRNCTRLGLTCSFADVRFGRAGSQGSISGAAASGDDVPSLRAHRACVPCKARKVRCSAESPSCLRCRQRDIECHYTGSSRRSRSPPGSLPASAPAETSRTSASPLQDGSVAVSGLDAMVAAAAMSESSFNHLVQAASQPLVHASVPQAVTMPAENLATTPMSLDPPAPTRTLNVTHSTSVLPDDQTIMRVFDNFFQQVHSIPTFSFFHKASLIHQSRTPERDECLLLAIVGITSLLTDLGDELRETGAQCAAAAERTIMAHYDEAPTLGKVQTLVIIVAYRMLTERFDAAFTLMSIAVRFAYALRLNYENPKLPFLVQESRRRLMWSVFLLDVSLASGQPDFSLCPAESIHLQLPCRETDFELNVSYATEPLVAPTEVSSERPPHLGLVAFFVRLTWIRARILRYTKLAALTSASADVGQITAQVLALGKELDDFALSLPRGFELTLYQLRLQAYSTRVVPYLLLHIWWRQCYCDLYRIGLEDLQEALPRPAIERLDPSFVTTCQQQCLEKASGMVEVFRLVLTSGSRPQFLDINLPVCAYQCARVLFYTFRNHSAHFGLTAQSVGEQARVCADMVAFFPGLRTDFLRIQADLRRLMDHGWFASPSPSRPSSAVPTTVFSRHSFIKKIGMSPAAGDGLQQQSQQPQHNTPDSMPSAVAPVFPPPSDPAANPQFVTDQSAAVHGFSVNHGTGPPDMRTLVHPLGQTGMEPTPSDMLEGGGDYAGVDTPLDPGGYYLYAPPMNPLAWVLDEWAGRDPAASRSFMQYNEFLPNDPGG